MLEIRLARDPSAPAMRAPAPGAAISGLREDTDYLVAWPGRLPGSRLCVDDVELSAGADGRYRWRPCFYAGQARAELWSPDGSRHAVSLDVGPSESKSGEQCFAEMVGQIRNFDVALLGGVSAATMVFGREGRPGLYSDDVLLSRLRQHGPSFVDAVASIAKSPHRALSADLQMLPLSRVGAATSSTTNGTHTGAIARTWHTSLGTRCYCTRRKASHRRKRRTVPTRRRPLGSAVC